MTPFSSFLVLFVTFNVCDEHHVISMWTKIFLSQELICHHMHARVYGIGVLLMEVEMGFTSPQRVGATLTSQGANQILESHVDRMVGKFLKMSILVFKNLGTKLSFFVIDCLFVEEELSFIVALLLSDHQMKNKMESKF
jgi:hypothetical protein